MKQLLGFLILLGANLNLAFGQTLIINQLGSLPSEVSESSGLEVGPDGCFWTHNDSGNDAILYCIDTTCAIIRTVSVTGTTNTDWEELAKDDAGNLYIGDFGNNSLNRTGLHILVIPSIDTNTVSAAVSDTIRFSYPDQQNFPPSGDYGNFDLEAMVWFNDSLHLFSKDRSSPSTGFTKQYKLPTTGGTYVAELVDSFEIGNTSFVFSITSADISEDNSKMVLLNAEKIWLFSNFSGSDFFGGDVAELEFGTFTQKEGIVFENGFLYLTDENSFGIGGNLYRVHPSVFVSVHEYAGQVNIQPIYNANLQLEEVRLNDLIQNATWQVFSLDGKLLEQGVVRNSAISSDGFNSENGVYVLRISIEDRPVKALLVRL